MVFKQVISLCCRIKGTQESSQSLDNLVQSLESKKSISTIDKSSYDWDKFKDKEGIKEEVENAKKNGYACEWEIAHFLDISTNRSSYPVWIIASLRRSVRRESASVFNGKMSVVRIDDNFHPFSFAV